MNKPVMQAEAASDVCASSESPGKHNPWIGLSRRNHLFDNSEIGDIISRASFYARAGVPIHLCGTAGQGKTSIALAIAHRLGRPICLMAGNAWLSSEDFIGKEVGNSETTVVDKYIQTVRRSETKTRTDWRHSLLANAMEQGQTLIYDEFTRATAEANGLLLSVLEEGVLLSTDQSNDRTYLQAHPDFRIILTSNPLDYAGVVAPPDALLDRMITLQIGPFQAATQIGMVIARTGVSPEMAERIVQTVNHFRIKNQKQSDGSIRASTLIGRIAAMRSVQAEISLDALAQIIVDVLCGRGLPVTIKEVKTFLQSNWPNEGPQ